jgi:hypothetical protein
MQQVYTQPPMQEALMRKNSNVLMPEAFGADHGFPVFDDLFLDN